MPREAFGPEHQFLERSELLSFEEIERLTRIFSSLGVTKVRLTGGEPLVRRDLERLVEMLAGIPSVSDLAMTTNGSMLVQKSEILTAAGLTRVSVSLDALDDETFNVINDVRFPVAKVLEGIEAAADAGLGPIKVNCVVKRGMNEHAVVEMARHFKGTGHIVRFIEYMDVGTTNGWRLDDVVPAREIVAMIDEEMPIEPIEKNYLGEVADRYRYADGSGEIGIIASVTQPFCGDCTRARISSEGKLFTCLFAAHGHDLREALRNGASDPEILDQIGALWGRRTDRYSEIRSSETEDLAKVEMSYIGG
jgi:cyclic pyranopterin phosphate synthase